MSGRPGKILLDMEIGISKGFDPEMRVEGPSCFLCMLEMALGPGRFGSAVKLSVQVSGFHSGVPVLPLDNCGTPDKLLDPFVVSVLSPVK